MIRYFDKHQVGYFTSPYPDAKPTYDPMFPCECPYCGIGVTEANVRTINVAWMKDREVSAFIRSHRACNTADRDNELDARVLDTIGEMVENGEIMP